MHMNFASANVNLIVNNGSYYIKSKYSRLLDMWYRDTP